VQPIAVFATKGAAKGDVLAKLLIECVVRLEAVGAEVLATVSDGATTNKNLWKNLGVSSAKGHVTNKVNQSQYTVLCYIGSPMSYF